MSKKVLMISDDPTFSFMMATIIDHLELQLLSVKNNISIWDNINEKNPSIVIWDFGNSTKVEKLDEKIKSYLPHDCHLLLFSSAISGLCHFKNGRLHLFQKPFSPSEISHLIKEIAD
ncbi:hypothetical protein KAU34_00975 [candidate division WOR-3 bacterium]|nr:hypothetical protein [candidate division WOR-3 bacterium]